MIHPVQPGFQTGFERSLIRLPHHVRNPCNAVRAGWHVVGLSVAHHLQTMLDFAVRAVMGGQFGGHIGGYPTLIRKRRQSCNGAARPKINIAPTRNQLAGLGEKLDLPNAADPQFQVVALDYHRAMQLAVVPYAQPHVMGVLNRCKIKMLAPDKRGQCFQEPRARVQITGAGARLDVSGALPRAPDAFIVAFGSRHRQADGRHRRIRAQAQINAKDIAFAGLIRQQGCHLAGHPDKGGACVLFASGVAGFVKKADQVDV